MSKQANRRSSSLVKTINTGVTGSSRFTQNEPLTCYDPNGMEEVNIEMIKNKYES